MMKSAGKLYGEFFIFSRCLFFQKAFDPVASALMLLEDLELKIYISRLRSDLDFEDE